MLFLVKELLGVVLAMNGDQIGAQRAQNAHRNAATVDLADIPPVEENLALDEQLFFIWDVVLRKPVELADAGEDRADVCLVCAGADHLAVGPFAQNGGDGIDDDGFACAGLAGQDVKATVEGDISLFDHSDILDMEQRKHGLTSWSRRRAFERRSLDQSRSFLISIQKPIAAWTSRMMIKSVSSPASVPTTTDIFMASMARPAAGARLGSVLMTTMFCA